MSVGSAFVRDTFTDTAGDDVVTQHTGEVGGTWAAQPGGSGGEALAISTPTGGPSGTAVTVSGTFGQMYTSGEPEGPNYDVDADFIFLSLIFAFGLDARMNTGANDSYRCGVISGTGAIQLRQVVGGVQTTIGTTADGYVVAPSQRHFKLGVRNIEKTLHVDGVLAIYVIDTVIAGPGRAGVNFGNNTPDDNAGTHIDNFIATNFLPEAPIQMRDKVKSMRPAAFSPGIGR